MMTDLEQASLPLEETLMEAVQCHQSGQFDKAEALYRKILQQIPNQPNANHNLGILALEAHQPLLSLPYFKLALEADPNEPLYWMSYVEALIQADQVGIARRVLEYGIQGGLQGPEIEALVEKLAVANSTSAQSILTKHHSQAIESVPNQQHTAEESNEDVQETMPVLDGFLTQLNTANQEPSIDLLNTLVNWFNAGQLDAAESAALALTQRFPEHGFGWKILGAIWQRLGQHQNACEAMSEAVKLLPNDVELLSNYGVALKNAGQVEAAKKTQLSALDMQADYAPAHYNLGNLLFAENQYQEASEQYLIALENQPNYVSAINNLGLCYKEMGDLQSAAQAFRACLAYDTQHAEANANLGDVLRLQGHYQEAEPYLKDAVTLSPNNIEAHCNLSLTLIELGRQFEARQCYEAAIERIPSSAMDYNALGNAYAFLLKTDQAEQAYRKAIQHNPKFVNAYCNLAGVLMDQGAFEEAELCYRKALELKPEHYKAYSSMLFAMTHFHNIDPQRLFDAHVEFSNRYEMPLVSLRQPHTQVKDPRKVLKVGIVSPDLHHGHPVVYFVEPVLRHLAKQSGIELYAYYNSPVNDNTSQALKGLFTAWQEVHHFNNLELAALIQDDQIDILLDLTGHTSAHRLLTFALKPAPIQLSWIGYPGTTGLQAMDYFLSDAYILPPGQFDHQFVEKIVQLPACAPFSPPNVAIQANALPALTNGYITFGSFNRLSKLNPEVIACWSRLLMQVPDSRLILGAMPSDDSYLGLVEQFGAHGVEAARLSFYPRGDMPTYLGLHQRVDLCLDTFPYNGGTTTWHALWMGVPTLTLSGDILPTRNGAGISECVGMGAFVAHSEEEFVQKGVYWAAHPEELAAIRQTLRTKIEESPAGHPEQIAAGLYNAMRTMWQRWCANAPPISFQAGEDATTVNIEPPRKDMPKTQPSPKTMKGKKGNKPAPIQAQQALANCYAQESLDTALQAARAFITQYPKDSYGWKVISAIYEQQNAIEQALEACQTAASFATNDAEIYYNMGNLLSDLSRTRENALDQAIKAYQQALALAPSFGQAHFNLAALFKQTGNLEQALVHYKKAYQAYPDNSMVIKDYAQALLSAGKHPESVACFQQLTEITPKDPVAYYMLGHAHLAAHDDNAAMDAFLHAIQLKPDYAEAFCALGNIHNAQARYDNAIHFYRNAIECVPQFLVAHNNLGTCYQHIGNNVLAEQSFLDAIEIEPDYALAHFNLGVTYEKSNQPTLAQKHYLEALRSQPDYCDAINNLGNIERALGHPLEAEGYYRKAIELNPQYMNAYSNLGNVLMDTQKVEEAEVAYQTAIALNPDYDDAYYNLGILLHKKDNIEDATVAYQKAIALNPQHYKAYNNLGNIMREMGDIDAAIQHYQQALQFAPDFDGALSNILFCFTHDPHKTISEMIEAHKAFRDRYETPWLAQWPDHSHLKNPVKVLRVGFVSGDLRNHAVSNFLEPVLKELQLYQDFKYVAYSNCNEEDFVTQRLKPLFHLWRNISALTHEALCNQIQQDQIDILIDLSGHTALHRLLTFARKPAPIQMSWFGYPGTSGLTAMDYYLSDNTILPEGRFDNQFTEKILRLPACVPFRPYDQAPELNALPALSEGVFTFGSFNRISKISRGVVETWCQLMQRVPNSRLVLGGVPKQIKSLPMMEWFKQAGIHEDRLLIAPRTDMANYLKQHHQVDLCLDTFPYNGGTTSWHALWMGVPTLTLTGNMLPSRVGCAIQGYMGLHAFITESQEAFVEAGVYWSQHLHELNDIRLSMRQRFANSPAQLENVTSGFVKGLRKAWQRWCDDLPAISFSVEADTPESFKHPSAETEQALVELFDAKRYQALETLAKELVKQYPNWSNGWKVLTDVQVILEKDAREAAMRSVELNRHDPKEHCYCGIVLKKLGDLKGAARFFQNAIELNPDYAEAYNNLGIVRKDLGEIEAAVACFQRALEIQPGYQECFSNYLFCISHAEGLDSQVLYEQHALFSQYYEAPLSAQQQAHLNKRDPQRNLRIGFVSADFRDHSLAYFLEPLMQELAKFGELSLIAYSNSDLQDSTTLNLRKLFKYWNDVASMNDEALATKIREDQIDILIDLSGHTSGNRLLTFARKPAPVQISWLGYLCTTGLAAMDYYFADAFMLPPGQFDHQFSEKIIQLPANAPFLPSLVAPEVNGLPALEKGYITFACFNRPNKITAAVVSLWAQVLHAVPNAKMLLGGMPEDGSYDRMIEWFANAGIGRERLSFHPRSFMKNYLTLHHEVDICLDTFPSNGVTTTCHSVWMGVPTIAINGTSLASRGAMAVMQHMQLDNFVADTHEDFVAKAVYWANHLDELAEIRASMRTRFEASPLGHPEKIAGSLLQAFRTLWKTWCDEQAPHTFKVEPLSPEAEKASKPARPIFVTQPLLSPLEEFVPYLEKIWDNKVLTNGGPFHQQLEQAMCEYLGVNHIALFTNGTLALLTALQALRVTGEVITTPYSFVATAHSLLWNGIKPVFVDIDPVTLNIDPSKIEAAITPATTAIMPVHCYGHPCDVERIQRIADNYNLKVIYDAAHCFGVRNQQGSILNHGDLSILSLHATKVFNTFEGGAIICPDAKTKHHIDHLKNFGFIDEVTVAATGINGKMSEINAAYGLLQLKGIDAALEKRKVVDAYYRQGLAGIKGIYCVADSGERTPNYAYFPILVQDEYGMSRDALYQAMRDAGIFARRYFYPLISDFPMYRVLPSAAAENLPNATRAANQVICLPIYPDLQAEQMDRIITLIREGAR